MKISDEAVQAAQNAYIEHPGDNTESHRAALTAAMPHLTGWKVKALEWTDRSNSEYEIRHEGRCGDFKYIAKAVRRDDLILCSGKYHTHIESAKAAAQADYAARILSAIEVSSPDIGNPITLVYTNYRGETSDRTITPIKPWLGSTEWHPEPQWLLTAFDHDKQANRDFALKDFGYPAPSPRAQALEEGDILNRAALIVEGRSTAVNSEFIESLSNRKAWEVASIVAEHDIKLGAAIRALSSQPVADGWLPQDVINLVIAAREAFDTGMLPEYEEHNLDKALEPFASRVLYENEPDALPASPGASE